MRDNRPIPPNGRFFTIKDDGAPAKCDGCDERSPLTAMLLVETPDGRRRVVHKECIDEDWLNNATDGGEWD